VTIVPKLPAGRPSPTPELLATVRRYLLRRRTIGTRLLVVGPEYVEVRIKASVRVHARADASRTKTGVITAVNTFLDPMKGGPDGRGWPFGRDVYRSEILQVIDAVPGVDYVLSLELFAGDDEASCGNVCIGPTFLAAPGNLEVEVS
jgi:predicted phage baseplate assembly protein